MNRCSVLLLSVSISAAAVGWLSLTEVRQQASAGPTGCAPERIMVSEQETLAWVATCNGHWYRCSGSVCSPEQPAILPSAPATSATAPAPPQKPIPSPEEGVQAP
jgi:hypothetical protein